MIRYLSAYEHPAGESFLWRMMAEALDEPHTTISHTKMPAPEEHRKWMANRTQRVLLIIEDTNVALATAKIGFVSVTHQNEIGIRIAKLWRGKGYGRRAVQHILDHYEPKPALPSVRPGKFVANINPANAASIALFTGLGARHLQSTFTF